MSGWHIDPVEQPDGTIKPVAAYGTPEDYEDECEMELAERMDENGND